MSCWAPHVLIYLPLTTLELLPLTIWILGTRNSTAIRSVVFKLNRTVAQHELLCTSILLIIFPLELLPLTSWTDCPCHVDISHDLRQTLPHRWYSRFYFFKNLLVYCLYFNHWYLFVLDLFESHSSTNAPIASNRISPKYVLLNGDGYVADSVISYQKQRLLMK